MSRVAEIRRLEVESTNLRRAVMDGNPRCGALRSASIARDFFFKQTMFIVYGNGVSGLVSLGP
jgi:hypothetical protein